MQWFDLKHISNTLASKRWPWHLSYWSFYAASRSVPYYATLMYYDARYLEFMLLSEIPLVLATYATLKLYTSLFAKKKYAIYFISGAAWWVGYVCFRVTFQKYYLSMMPEIANTGWWDIFLNSISSYFVTFILLTMAKYFKDNFITQYFEGERKLQQTQFELTNLKAQISPHFLFNTMNNFYGLAVEQNNKLPSLMVKLSELLRYSLYETNSQTVLLQNEINYIKNYIELEKIRLEETLKFEFTSTISETSEVQIAPLLFVVFIENAFKHAKNVEKEPIEIKIRMELSEDGVLLFEVKNNCQKNNHQNERNKGGMGLENVKKRLQVLYPNGMHTLTIENSEGYFKILLKIKVKIK